MVRLHQPEFKDEKKDTLTRIFDFVMHIIGSTYNNLSIIPIDLLTEIHLRFGRMNKVPNKKILGYWDFNQRVGKLGDFMVFLETLSALRSEFNLNQNTKNIDVCFIDDKNHHNAKIVKFSRSYLFKNMLKSLVIINPYINSVFFFQSNKDFERFYLQNKEMYLRWPPSVSGTASYDVRIIEKSYEKSKILPKFEVPSEILTEIYEFYESKIFPSLPIIINIRNNIREIDKNSNIKEIKAFLKYYEKKNYKFIIICNKSEIPQEFRSLKNVIFSKDYFEFIEYDLALIKSSYISIFPGSGMACFAWYGDVPFIQYGIHGTSCVYSGLPQKPLNHFSKYQRRYFETETSEWLISRFEELINYLKENNINNTLRNKVTDFKEYVSKF